MSFDIDIGFTSDTGKKPTNEDFAAAMLPERGQEGMGAIVAIADGVSTGGMGREAAQTTVTSLVRDYFGTPETWDTTVALDRIIGAQNAWLAGINRRRHPALGLCTLTALVLRGLRAGDGGFQVNVKGDTTLTGGAITSTDKAVNEGKNSFTTGGTLTTTDVQTEARYTGDGPAASITLAGGGGGEKPPEGQETRTHTTVPKTGGSAGMGEDSGNASSVTTAGISGIAGDKDKRTGDAEQGITPIFDKDKVQKEIDAQIKITQEFGQQASKAVGDYAQTQVDKARDLQAQAAQTSDPAERDALLQQATDLQNQWGDNGSLRLTLHTVIGGLTGGASGAAGAAVGTLSAPAVADALHNAGIDASGVLGQTITALASTAAGAAVGGTAGAVAAGNEVVNNYLTHAQELAKKAALEKAKTEKEKQTITEAYDRVDAQQRNEAAACLLKDQCGSVFDKPNLAATLQELDAACTAPRLCTPGEQKSIVELKNFYAEREAVKPDTTVEEFLLTNKAITSALSIAKGVIVRIGAQMVTPAAKPLGVVPDFAGNPVAVMEAASQYAFKTEANIGATGANLENSAAQFVRDEAGKDFIGVFASKTGNNNGIDLAYAKMVNGQPQLIIGEAKAGDSALTALGENYEKTLIRNLEKVRGSINEIANEDIKRALLTQLQEKTYQVELYTSVGNAAKAASRVDDVLINRMGQPISRIVTFGKN